MVSSTGGRFFRPVGYIIDSFSWYCSIITFISLPAIGSEIWLIFVFLGALLEVLLLYIHLLIYPVFTCLFHFLAWAVRHATVRETAAVQDPVLRDFYGREESRQATLRRWENYLGSWHLTPAQSWQPHDNRLMSDPLSLAYLESLGLGGNAERDDVTFLT